MTNADRATRTLESARIGKVTELFPYALPFRASAVIGLFIIVVFAAALVAAVAVKIPETIRCPFILIPEGGADPIQAPFQGGLEEVRVAEGETVNRDQVLFVIRSTEIHNWHTELRTLEEDLTARQQRQARLKQAHRTRVSTQQAEIIQYENEVVYQKKYLAANQDLIKRMEALVKEGLSSPVELLSHQVGLAGAERDVAVAEQKHRMSQLSLQQLETDWEIQAASEDMELKKTSLHIEALREQLRDCQNDLFLVRAPYQGTVLSIAFKRPGDVVTVGQALCEIARAEASPRARLTVAEEGIPRLREGQPVKLHFEAFPYQRYGTCGGTLQWVSPAAVTGADRQAFVAIVALDTLTMNVAGEARPLRVGMRGEARIIVGRRALIEHVFEPLRQLRENVTVSKQSVGAPPT